MPSKSSPLPITFAVFHNDEPADVTLDFADNADVISTTRWRVPNLDDDAMQARAADAREFALLAAKRWRHYRDTDAAALNLADLQRMIATDPQGEFCFHLKVTADWFPVSLGGAMVRRTWCHHLIIDFLFVHPSICGRTVSVKGVGIKLLRAICMIACALGCKRVWGEATRDSAPFYEQQLSHPVEDLFAFEHSDTAALASSLEAERRFA